MVFQAISKTETLERKSTMATAPVKSQPLHNFSLSFLKWGKNQMNNHRCRKLSDSSRESPPIDHRSSASEAESDDGSLCKKESELENRKYPVGSRSVKNHDSFSYSSSTLLMQNQTVPDGETGVEELKSKLFIRLRTGSRDDSVSKNKSSVVAADDGGGGGGEVEESVRKPWNLRPRRAVLKSPNEIGGTSRIVEFQENLSCTPQPPENLPKSLRLRGLAEAQTTEKKEKRKFSIALSRDEIEEDFFIMTGSKPPRRPKKRAKNIQKQVDNAFPGLWLAEITADSYKVPDDPIKR